MSANGSEPYIPVCIFCSNPFDFLRTPYLLPCNDHSACKECLKTARQQKMVGLACPEDKVEISLSNLKSLTKNVEILRYLEQVELDKKKRELQETMKNSDDEDKRRNDELRASQVSQGLPPYIVNDIGEVIPLNRNINADLPDET